jgi:hypothetical protein
MVASFIRCVYNSRCRKGPGSAFVKPDPFPFWKLRFPDIGEPAASNRRDSVDGLTRRGPNLHKRLSVGAVPPKPWEEP